jgi:hypothetical protein
MSRRLPPRRFQQAMKAGLPAVRRAPHPQGSPDAASVPVEAESGGDLVTFSATLPPGVTLGWSGAPEEPQRTYAASGLPPGMRFDVTVAAVSDDGRSVTAPITWSVRQLD